MNFTENAKYWDTEIRVNRAEKIAAEIGASIDLNCNMKAMEFGCGTGLISFNLYKLLKEITLIDSSEGMIETLISKIEKYQTENMTAKALDLSVSDEVNEKYDLIYSSMAFHHINNIPEITRTLYNLLNENGCICIVDLDKEDGSFHKKEPDFNGHNGFDQNELKKILQKSGFLDIESKTFFYNSKEIEGKQIEYSLFIITGRK